MTSASSKFLGPKEIVIIGIASMLVCAIIISTTWVQLVPYFSTVVYIIAIVLVAPLMSLYLDRKNPLISDRAKSINIEKVTIILGLIGITIVLSVMSVAVLNVRSYYVSDMLALIVITIPLFISLCFDYLKNLAPSGPTKNARLVTVLLGSTLGILVIAMLYLFMPNLPLNLLIIVLPLAIVFVAPLISLYFDNKNPAIGTKNRKFNRNKAIITIAVGFLIVIAILLTVFLNLMLYL